MSLQDDLLGAFETHSAVSAVRRGGFGLIGGRPFYWLNYLAAA